MSQFPSMVDALPLYRAFSCDFDCKIIEADISRLRMVAISFSNYGICPMFANSSSKHRTLIGSLPLYTSSALSQSRLNNCEYMILTMKLNVVSVSEIMTNNAVFFSPKVSSSSSSNSRSTAFLKF